MVIVQVGLLGVLAVVQVSRTLGSISDCVKTTDPYSWPCWCTGRGCARCSGQLNPLGPEVTKLYLRKTGAMVRDTVFGQFVIALCQGVAEAASIYIAGFHHGFFIFAILLTTLSIIPLGGGIVTIPFGIGMIFYGNIFGWNCCPSARRTRSGCGSGWPCW